MGRRSLLIGLALLMVALAPLNASGSDRTRESDRVPATDTPTVGEDVRSDAPLDVKVEITTDVRPDGPIVTDRRPDYPCGDLALCRCLADGVDLAACRCRVLYDGIDVDLCKCRVLYDGLDFDKCRCRILDSEVDFNACLCRSLSDQIDYTDCRCRLYEHTHGHAHRRCHLDDNPHDYVLSYKPTIR